MNWQLAFKRRVLGHVYIYSYINIKVGYNKIGHIPFLWPRAWSMAVQLNLSLKNARWLHLYRLWEQFLADAVSQAKPGHSLRGDE